MADSQPHLKKTTLDKDLGKLVELEAATVSLSRGLAGPGIALLFLALSMAFASFYAAGAPGALTVIAASAIGAYMALNIGANDVANNVGPAVGSRAMTLGGALAVAAICESAGALIAGGDVVGTISKGIIDPAAVREPPVFIAAMMAALISSALWVNLATWIGAPVSTTHSVVGGVMGAGIAAAGFSAVNWPTMGAIAASWIISPVMGGVIAAVFLAFIKSFIIYQEDKIAAARRWVPVLIAIMAGCFVAYLAMKGLKKVIDPGPAAILALGIAAAGIAWLATNPLIHRQSQGMDNRNQSLRKLFHLPLICSAAMLSFAHGANDVANAVGPLAAIVHTAELGEVATEVAIPVWVMVIGAIGISVGLWLFGPKLVRVVGEQITKLNPMRAYCVALAAAITVIIASWLGLPVSSTHIAVGAVFGVGFFREWYTARSKRRRAYLERKHGAWQKSRASGKREGKARAPAEVPLEDETVRLTSEEMQRRRLVRRTHFTTIIAAWVVTVPCAAILAVMLFWLIRLAA